MKYDSKRPYLCAKKMTTLGLITVGFLEATKRNSKVQKRIRNSKFKRKKKKIVTYQAHDESFRTPGRLF